MPGFCYIISAYVHRKIERGQNPWQPREEEEEEAVSRKEENNGHLEGGETLYGKIKARRKYHACPKKDKE